MTAKVLMLQGTGSDVGKSVLTAAFCRIVRRKGFTVAPFKPQNMSNNAAACATGGEIGRAQALQALACGLEPHIDMNPVLLKPETDRIAQVVVHGQALHALEAADYMANRHQLMGAVLEGFNRLTQNYDYVFVEGAGSPAEINLRAGDIANMGFARAAGIPVCLIGDINKGGVIASLVGTQSILDASDAAMIRGFLVNKFRGNLRLFDNGVTEIENRTGWPCFGVIPWVRAAAKLPEEDAVKMHRSSKNKEKGLKIAAPMLSRIANCDDADPLKLEPGVSFQWVPPGKPIPRDVDVIIVFGTKSTIGDLAFLRDQGWDHDIIAHARTNGQVLGICGGYQMLGNRISDPLGVDGKPGESEGLGLLDVDTVMNSKKRVAPVAGSCALTGKAIAGYEIHLGETVGEDTERPMLFINGKAEGARSRNGRIEGTYLHGAFNSDPFRRAWLKRAGAIVDSGVAYSAEVERALDGLADSVEAVVDIESLLRCAQSPGWSPNDQNR